MKLQGNSFSYDRRSDLINKPLSYQVYSAGGDVNLNPWTMNQTKAPVPKNISLQNQYGGPIGTYRIPLIRPMDTVAVPHDIKRGSVEELCRWPVYAGSKFQQWCSEDNAMKFHAMRPIVNSDQYTENLSILFDTIVMRSL